MSATSSSSSLLSLTVALIRRPPRFAFVVVAPRDGEDLLSAIAALRRAPDQAGHVEDLDLRAAMLEEPRDHIEGREVIGSDRALRVRDLVQQGRLADGRKADESDRRIPALLHGVAGAASAGLA